MTVAPADKPRELVEVLLTLGRLSRTGILTAQREHQIIGMTFLEGEIVSADALNESLEESLGEVLASRDLVGPEKFASLVAEYEAGGGRVADLLVERRFLDRQQLMDTLRWHHYLLCREVLSWEQSQYKFYPGGEVSYEEGVTPLTVEEVLIRAAEDLGSSGPLPGPLPAADAVFERVEGGGVAAGQDELLLGLATGDTEGATSILREMDGKQTVAGLAESAGLTEFEARLTLYLLARTGQTREIEAEWEEPRSRAAQGAAARVARARATFAEVGARWLEKDRVAPAWLKRIDTQELAWRPWPPRLLGALLIVLLVGFILGEPSHVLLPFPWQESLRRGVLDEQTSAAYLKIDRGAKTSFLLDGHFPETLDGLVQGAFLSPRDLLDPASRRLGYAAQVAGYLIYPLDEGELAPGTSRTEAITGNFLLDPEFVPGSAVEEPPLVLLD